MICFQRPLRRWRRRVPPPVWAAGTLVLLAAGGLCLLSLGLRPVLTAAARSAVSALAVQAIQAGVEAELGEEPVAYRDLMAVETGEGGVTTLQSNMAAVNLLKSRLLARAVEAVSQLSAHEVAIPLGTLTGIDLLSGRGPAVAVKFLSVGAAEAELVSQFDQAGINQTRHRVLVEVRIALQLLLPGGVEEVAVTDQICVAETVILGQVPQIYLGPGS